MWCVVCCCGAVGSPRWPAPGRRLGRLAGLQSGGAAGSLAGGSLARVAAKRAPTWREAVHILFHIHALQLACCCRLGHAACRFPKRRERRFHLRLYLVASLHAARGRAGRRLGWAGQRRASPSRWKEGRRGQPAGALLVLLAAWRSTSPPVPSRAPGQWQAAAPLMQHRAQAGRVPAPTSDFSRHTKQDTSAHSCSRLHPGGQMKGSATGVGICGRGRLCRCQAKGMA